MYTYIHVNLVHLFPTVPEYVNFSYWSFSMASVCARSYPLFLRQPLPRPRAPPFPSTTSIWPWPDRPLERDFYFSRSRPPSCPEGQKRASRGSENKSRTSAEKKSSTLPVYSSSASPHTTRPARVLSFPHPPSIQVYFTSMVRD